MAASQNPRTSTDSNPGPTLHVDNTRPVSFISSRMTDIASEDGEPNSRTGMPSPSLHSRRGPPPTRHSAISQSTQGAAGRPGSSGSRMSRTHIPSLTSHAFFRPMSSQRLQAQRSGRPLTTMTNARSTEDDHNEDATQARRSFISATTGPQPANIYEEERAPPSRGTEFTDPVTPERGTSAATPTINTTARSVGDNVRLLNDRGQNPPPSNLNISKNYKTNGSHDAPQRSPLSFRSGFLRGSKNGNSDRRDSRGHERLSSAVSTPQSTPAKIPQPLPKSKLGRNYEYFMGNTIFFAGGRLQNSRDKPVNIATALFIVLPTALFFAYSGPWLWHNVSPALPIIFAYLFFLCMSSFIHASVVDPGIIPRNLHVMPPDDPTEDPLTLGPPTTDWVMIKLPGAETAAMDVPVKYCKTCSIWRPPRCYHCRVCDNCVEALDHHCVWLNNCVGRRNYRYFFGFVASATVLGLLLFGLSLTHCLLYSSRQGISFHESINEWRVPFAMVIYGAVASPYPAALWGYHLFLMGRGETTREYLNARKFKKADRHRPFTQGNFFRNWIAVLGRPRPPTYLQFSKPYMQGDQRFASRKVEGRKRQDLEAQGGDLEMQNVNSGHPTFEGPAGRGAISNKPAPS